MKKAVLISLFVAVSLAREPLVEGPLGKLRGTTRQVLDVEIESFLGIPYAKPPVGRLRFARAEPFGPVGELDAFHYGFSCPQPMFYPLQEFSNTTDSENCLFLNVFRKQGTRSSDNKAVVVLIHGGGFLFGSGGHVEYDMAPLAGLGDVITVSFNYRLGILGFGYVKDSEFQNLGLFDQRLALEWVQDNIAAFGGDPDRVTLIGVSAGAVSISAHIITPLNKQRKLFRAALLDAGVVTSLLNNDPEVVSRRTKCVAEAAGCTDQRTLIECLREVNVDDLVRHVETAPCGGTMMRFVLTSDGVFLPKNTADYVRDHADDFVKVKTMIGYGRDEGSVFAAMFTHKFPETMAAAAAAATAAANDENDNDDDEGFRMLCARLAEVLGYKADIWSDATLRKRVFDLYVRKFVDPFTIIGHLLADGTFICPENAFIDSYSRVNDQLYVYRFERLLEGSYFSLDPEILGVYHISPFVHFTGTYLGATNENHRVLEADKAYMLDTMKVLSDFAKSDDPPFLRGVKWPNYSKGEGVLVVNNNLSIRSGLPHRQQCSAVFGHFESSKKYAKTEL